MSSRVKGDARSWCSRWAKMESPTCDRNNLEALPRSGFSKPSYCCQGSISYLCLAGAYFVFPCENNAVAAYAYCHKSAYHGPAWSVSRTGLGSVTSTDGTNNAIVWVAGAGGDGRLRAYDGDTGNVVYAGGGANR